MYGVHAVKRDLRIRLDVSLLRKDAAEGAAQQIDVLHRRVAGELQTTAIVGT